MPFWKYFVMTKPEVDDDDLPLAKHRIYDDDGNLKPLTLDSIQRKVNTAQGKPKTSPKKEITLTPKTRARILRSVGVSPTGPRRVPEPSTPITEALTTPESVKKRAVRPSVENSDTARALYTSNAETSTPDQKAKGGKGSLKTTPKKSETPKRSASTPSKSPKKEEPKTQPTTATEPAAKLSPKKRSAASKETTPRKSASPQKENNKRKADSPVNVTPPAKKPAASKKAERSRSASPQKEKEEKSPVAQTSPKAKAKGAASKRSRSETEKAVEEVSPQRSWSIDSLRAFAAERKIDISQCKKKVDIFNKIKDAL
ncbi:hypothetical protein DPX39_030058000 [Trypanosoma brucei equiperdum]|uniref:Uncharacterized protein n=1 Tax=Trypanosoma brucei equiperdum TaxID=630700 RepID=A0A3L6LAF2_9TRYP|nr:hypothetical protein DPX39_030053000 [Trypanosoma brucei equiperdum]RHW73551.1 hypothetical protein DPX39_030063000 [Trypanosoma brucei equiperdum]RHW73653.1 hypothetical protein DPX39_030068000 [Trypanosoma brucei equiperdum]RHW73811.1 hypothetical protein DPX39_030058000 [Trypanosoma brucei equiperdum]